MRISIFRLTHAPYIKNSKIHVCSSARVRMQAMGLTLSATAVGVTNSTGREERVDTGIAHGRLFAG